MTQEPVMVLPNGDILRKGDYAQLYNGKIVGPVKYRPEEKDDTEALGGWRVFGTRRMGCFTLGALTLGRTSSPKQCVQKTEKNQ
jgi:hypothetical protein